MLVKLDTDIRAGIAARDRAGAAVRPRNVTWLPLVCLLALTAFIAVDRAVISQVPFNVDPSSYAVVSHELLNGRSLYVDIWDHKPPTVFVVYAAAELVFGYSPQTLVILNLLLSIVILVGFYYAGKAGSGGVTAGICAAGLWALFSGNFQLEARDPNTEPFLIACLVWAFALLAAERPHGLRPRTALLIGLLFLIASSFKPIILPVAVCLAIAHVVLSEDRRKAVVDVFIFGAVGLVGWLTMFGYFWATNRFDVFYRAIIDYNQFYSGSMLANVLAPFRGEVEFFPETIARISALGVTGALITLLRDRRQACLLLAFLGSTWVAIALPGRFSIHYYQLWLPSLIIGTAWAIGYLSTLESPRIRRLSYAVAAIAIAGVVLSQAPMYRSVVANSWTPVIRPLNSSVPTAAKINEMLEKDESFFLWGNTPTIYLLTGRRPPAAVLFDMHFIKSPVSEQLTTRVKADLEQNRPELLVVESGRPAIPDWLAADYLPTPVYVEPDAFSFYARRGGRLAAQQDTVR